jgi:hypothetical protein
MIGSRSRIGWTRRMSGVGLGLLAAGGLAASAVAAGPLPLSPTFLGAQGHSLAVRPAVITYTGDGTGLLGGARVRTGHTGIHWTSWGASTAHGTGYDQLNDCNPSCAGGTYHGYAVRIEMWRPRHVHGQFVFTRLTIFFVHHRPANMPAHYTFTDVRIAGGLGWMPPSAQGYCVHTQGQPPAAGCANIHALP